MEVTLLDHRFLRARPSLIAAVGMYTSKRMLQGKWVSSIAATPAAPVLTSRVGRCLCLLLQLHRGPAAPRLQHARRRPLRAWLRRWFRQQKVRKQEVPEGKLIRPGLGDELQRCEPPTIIYSSSTQKPQHSRPHTSISFLHSACVHFIIHRALDSVQSLDLCLPR